MKQEGSKTNGQYQKKKRTKNLINLIKKKIISKQIFRKK
jgi:hypothetical protein